MDRLKLDIRFPDRVPDAYDDQMVLCYLDGVELEVLTATDWPAALRLAYERDRAVAEQLAESCHVGRD